MFFDELDKACYHHGRNEIYDVLIHVIDSTTNAEFNDKFFQDICFPINKVLFMFSFNDRSKIDPILLDRMEIIKVDAYTPEDKVNIVNKFIMKELKEDIGLEKLNIKISDSNITYLIDSFTQEPGVRSIRRKIEKILLKINKEKIFKTGIFEKSRDLDKIEITRDLIDKYLVKPAILVKKISPVSEIGTINGLYATSMGDGGIIPILIYKNQSGKSEKFTLKLTGKQGKVMQESVSFAFTIAINLVKEKYGSEFFNNYPGGLHIHTPDGATSKDGPSAGSAFTLGFLSRILNKRIKNDISITGEIERDGCITAIGGLEYKLPGAKKAGVRLVFIPKENEKDLEKIIEHNKTLFDSNFKYQIVDHIRDVLDMAFVEDKFKNISTYDKLFDHKKYLNVESEGIVRNKKAQGKKNAAAKVQPEKIVDPVTTTDENDSKCDSICGSENENHSTSSSDRSK
jgi:ATP-dependent Lon protease